MHHYVGIGLRVDHQLVFGGGELAGKWPDINFAITG